ncbi:MAG: hypothetical protein WCJ30_29140, partial [Deltaproteobacteria bacterium]
MSLALGALIGAGCRSPRTQIVVWVWSDLPVTGPDSLDTLALTVSGGGRTDRPPFIINVNPSLGNDAGVRALPGAVLTLYPDDNTAPYPIDVSVDPMHAVPGGTSRPLYAFGAFRRST